MKRLLLGKINYLSSKFKIILASLGRILSVGSWFCQMINNYFYFKNKIFEVKKKLFIIELKFYFIFYN